VDGKGKATSNTQGGAHSRDKQKEGVNNAAVIENTHSGCQDIQGAVL